MTLFKTTIHYAVKFSKIITSTNNSKLNFFLKVGYIEISENIKNVSVNTFMI